MLAKIDRFKCIGKVLLLTLLCTNPVWADDTEIFFGRASDESVQPNVLFVLDGSGSMNWYDCENIQSDWDSPDWVGSKYVNTRRPCPGESSPNANTTRLSRLKSSLSDVLNNTSNVNVGLMRFSHSSSGGRILYPIRPIDQQFCNGEPCGDDTIFSAQARTSEDADDAVELYSGEVKLDQNALALMTDTAESEDNAWIGLRFPELQIPQGATITDARLQFKSTINTDAPTQLLIHAEDANDSAPYEETNYNVSGRDRTYNSVNWSEFPEWDEEGVYESPNLSSLIQQVVNKPGWCGGNALGLTVKGTGERLVSAFDAGAANGPALTVSYRLTNIPPTGGCTKTTILSRVSSNSDDATEERRFNRRKGIMSRWRGANIVSDPNKSSDKAFHTGIRFTDVQIPQGANILDATITMTTKTLGWHTLTAHPGIDIYAQNSSNPSTFSGTRYNLSNRSLTSSVHWANDDLNISNNAVSVSPSIASIVQGVVNKGSWKSGNPLAFVLKPAGKGGYTFYSRDRNAAKAPLLKVEYETKIRTASDKITGPVTDVRTELLEEMDAMVANHGTPTVGALLEARNYFSGGAVDYGKTRSVYRNHSTYSKAPYYYGRYSRVSALDSYTGGTLQRGSSKCLDTGLDSIHCVNEYISGSPYYISPFTHECQSNHIVLLTDGAPTADSSAVSKVESITGGTCESQTDDEGTCGEEIAQFMVENDQHSSTGDQFITTHTIGFNFTTQWLRDVASAGGGNFYTADSAGQLSAALASIISSVQDDATTFVAPGATVDHFSKISHRNDVYLALFQPKSTPRWVGNLKRYDFSGNPAELHDRDGDPAVDPDTGYFKAGSRSFWSADDDNNEVGAGGAAGRLVAGSRNIYTYTGGEIKALTDAAHEFDEGNEGITPDDLGLGSNDENGRDELLEWARGYDVKDENADSSTTDSRYYIGDPLHSKPAIVTYGGTSEAPDSVIYFGTNEGFLHGIETDSGDEVFSFIPLELLPNLKPQFDNIPGADKIYGLDGAISVWKNDINRNGAVDGDDHVYLYAGMRRGGSSYYALNVTNKNAPVYKWQIDGGPGGTTGFEELGETWSQPVVANISYGGTTKKVLVFGGGYDNSQDDKLTRTADSIGRALYIVDAENGDLLWRGVSEDSTVNGIETEVFSDMVYSIPATPKVIDIDGDGNSDQIYVGDMGGRIWRFDIIQSSSTLKLDGGIIADLGTDGVMSDTRRFYHTPDVSLSRVNAELVVNIAIGSGYQAHPLDTTIDDRFYLIRYPYAYRGDGIYGIKNKKPNDAGEGYVDTYSPIDEDNLYNATMNLIGEGTDDQVSAAQQALAGASGWYIEMEQNGEKVLGSSVTFDNKVLFASYLPGTASTGCSPHIGAGVFWAVNLWDATPVEDFDDDDTQLSKPDRTKMIPGAGLPPPPQTLILQTKETDDNGEEVKGDLQIITVSGGNTLMNHSVNSLFERVYWSEYPNF
jgi:type IV pilus assembly protein PilY1